MDCTKDELIKHAIGRLETIEETLLNAQEYISAAYAERRVVWNLLFLACEKSNTDVN